MLIAGSLAGVAPLVPNPIRSSFFPDTVARIGSTDQHSACPVQIGWPTSLNPIIWHGNGKNYLTHLQLRNASNDAQCISMSVRVLTVAENERSAEISPSRPFKINPWDMRLETTTLTITNAVSEPLTGLLRLSVIKAASKSEDVPCTPADGASYSFVDQPIKVPYDGLMGIIFLGSLASSVVVVTVTAINLLRKKVGLFNRMGPLNWSFEKSWGANVTLGGALLITLIGITIFPDHPQLMAKSSYTLLQVLFGALVSLAPLVYNLIHQNVEVKTNNVATINTQGYVALFLIAGGLVLWAATGQVITLGVLTEEFVRGGALDQMTGRALQGLAILLYALLLVYGFRSLYRTPKQISATADIAGQTTPGPRPAAALAALQAPISEWTIL